MNRTEWKVTQVTENKNMSDIDLRRERKTMKKQRKAKDRHNRTNKRKNRTKRKTKEQNRKDNNKRHRKQKYFPTQNRANMPTAPHSGLADCAERLSKISLVQ